MADIQSLIIQARRFRLNNMKRKVERCWALTNLPPIKGQYLEDAEDEYVNTLEADLFVIIYGGIGTLEVVISRDDDTQEWRLKVIDHFSAEDMEFTGNLQGVLGYLVQFRKFHTAIIATCRQHAEIGIL